MSKRASLPRADELFRKTQEAVAEEAPQESREASSSQKDESTSRQVAEVTPVQGSTESKPKHDEKVTYYCTADDLTRLERTRLELRATHGITADRGKVVRAALAEILSEFETRGANSSLVRRLQDDDEV